MRMVLASCPVLPDPCDYLDDLSLLVVFPLQCRASRRTQVLFRLSLLPIRAAYNVESHGRPMRALL